MDATSLKSFLVIHTVLEPYVERNLAFMELSRCLNLSGLITRAMKLRGDDQEYLNSIAISQRYAKQVAGISDITSLRRVMIEIIAVGRGSMQGGPRAAIANIDAQSVNGSHRSNFKGGT